MGLHVGQRPVQERPRGDHAHHNNGNVQQEGVSLIKGGRFGFRGETPDQVAARGVQDQNRAADRYSDYQKLLGGR